MRLIYVVDNMENMCSMISQSLLREGFRVETFASIEALMLCLQFAYPDLFILDIVSPDLNSLECYSDISKRSALPVIFTADSNEDIDQLKGLGWGSFEYLLKPFSPRELVSRVRAIFRHAPCPVIAEEIFEMGNLTVNPNDRRTVVDNQEVMLTPQEYELLLLLVQQPQRTFNRLELLDRIWGCDYVGEIRAVDNLVKRLRKKLRQSGSIKNVKTVWGCGYRFDD